MRLSSRHLLPLVSLGLAFGLANAATGGCALVTDADLSAEMPGPDRGAGGAGAAAAFNIHDSSGSTTGAGGGSGLAWDAGPDAAVFAPVTSYQYLCGGSNPVCLPGTATDTCALGGNPGIGGSTSNAPEISCQLVVPDGGNLTAQCGRAGAGGDGDPCLVATDCGPELGCMLTNITPICRPYCCAGLESCPANTYCVKAPMAEAPTTEIPVCTPAMTCELLDDTTCPTGLTCTIVRESGTTSCVTPGTGTYGAACPCAAGFTCSWAEGTCLQLCHTAGNDCGANAFCQGGQQPYPNGIGHCVSY